MNRPPDTRPIVSRPSLEVADIFRGHGPAWRRANAGHVSLGQLKVMSAIENCRTAALGGHVARCEKCARSQISYNSCRNRHCPKWRGLVQRFASGCDASPRSCPGSHVCANTSHDEPAPTRARKWIPLLRFRRLFHPPLSRSRGFSILRSIFGHPEFSVSFCSRDYPEAAQEIHLGSK
jgi:hypothetical protein